MVQIRILSQTDAEITRCNVEPIDNIVNTLPPRKHSLVCSQFCTFKFHRINKKFNHFRCLESVLKAFKSALYSDHNLSKNVSMIYILSEQAEIKEIEDLFRDQYKGRQYIKSILYNYLQNEKGKKKTQRDVMIYCSRET